MSEVRFFNAIEGQALTSVKVIWPYSPTPLRTLTLYHGATADETEATAYQANWYNVAVYGGEFDFITGQLLITYDSQGNPIHRRAAGVAVPITALTGLNVFWTDAGEIQIGGEGLNKSGFTLDGVSSLYYGVGLSGTGVWDAPARKGESISVPGRNGSIWIDDGSYENIMVTYPCWMSEGFDERVDDFRAYLSRHSDAYYKLTDSYHPLQFRLGRYAGAFTATPGAANKTGRMDVTFDCQPQRFLKAGFVWQSLDIPDIDPSEAVATVFSGENPTGFKAAPVLMVSAASAVQDTAQIELSLRNDAQNRYIYVQVLNATPGKFYYIDCSDFSIREGDTAEATEWEDFSTPEVAKLNLVPRSGSYTDYTVMLYEGTNTINNRTMPIGSQAYTNLARFSILTRYWSI